jgi:hypothetical protein
MLAEAAPPITNKRVSARMFVIAGGILLAVFCTVRDLRPAPGSWRRLPKRGPTSQHHLRVWSGQSRPDVWPCRNHRGWLRNHDRLIRDQRLGREAGML